MLRIPKADKFNLLFIHLCSNVLQLCTVLPTLSRWHLLWIRGKKVLWTWFPRSLRTMLQQMRWIRHWPRYKGHGSQLASRMLPLWIMQKGISRLRFHSQPGEWLNVQWRSPQTKTFPSYLYRTVLCVMIAMPEKKLVNWADTFATNASKYTKRFDKNCRSPWNLNVMNVFVPILVASSMAHRFVSVEKFITDIISIVHPAARSWIRRLVKSRAVLVLRPMTWTNYIACVATIKWASQFVALAVVQLKSASLQRLASIGTLSTLCVPSVRSRSWAIAITKSVDWPIAKRITINCSATCVSFAIK